MTIMNNFISLNLHKVFKLLKTVNLPKQILEKIEKSKTHKQKTLKKKNQKTVTINLTIMKVPDPGDIMNKHYQTFKRK